MCEKVSRWRELIRRNAADVFAHCISVIYMISRATFPLITANYTRDNEISYPRTSLLLFALQRRRRYYKPIIRHC